MKEEFDLTTNCGKLPKEFKTLSEHIKGNDKKWIYVKDVKEFIRQCEDNSEETNGKSYIKISKMQKLAGDKLI